MVVIVLLLAVNGETLAARLAQNFPRAASQTIAMRRHRCRCRGRVEVTARRQGNRAVQRRLRSATRSHRSRDLRRRLQAHDHGDVGIRQISTTVTNLRPFRVPILPGDYRDATLRIRTHA
jgi:hypothetical protein